MSLASDGLAVAVNTTLQGGLNHGVDGGASETYAITLTPAPGAYVDGM